MAWLATDENGTECIYNDMPQRDTEIGMWVVGEDDYFIYLPTGSIRKLVGYDVLWKDSPVEIK